MSTTTTYSTTTFASPIGGVATATYSTITVGLLGVMAAHAFKDSVMTLLGIKMTTYIALPVWLFA